MDESTYTLYEKPLIKKEKGYFKKGHTPWNKGLSWEKQGVTKEEREKRLKILQSHGHRWEKGHSASHTGRPVIQYDDYGNRLHWYLSSEAAARKLGVHGRNIRSVCDGKRKHCGGFRWAWDKNF